MEPILNIVRINKDFVFHHQGGTRISVLDQFSMIFYPGQTTLLTGPSGSGKSTLLRMIYAGYLISQGQIWVRHRGEMKNLAEASSAMIYEIRRDTIGYVSQFLRVIPRVSALDTVIEPLLARRMDRRRAQERGRRILERLNIPKPLWHLSATTFSGGEQQRVNLARGFAAPYPILLLDEPTASLDSENRKIVMELIREALENKTCVIGIFHDPLDQEALGGRIVKMAQPSTLASGV